VLDLISKQIHDRAVEKASKYLVAEAELLSAIIDVDRNRLYEKFDETYLTPYCVKYLKLGDDVAAMFVRVARKSLQVPELEIAVQEGLQISKAKTIASVIDTKNKDQWIARAQSLSKEKLEREVASANPSAPKPEKAKPTGPDRIRIEFEVTHEEAEERRQKNQMKEDPKVEPKTALSSSQSKRQDCAQNKYESRSQSVLLGKSQGATQIDFPRQSRDRPAMPAAIRHQVYLREAHHRQLHNHITEPSRHFHKQSSARPSAVT
jgi:hypothetical protein